MVTGVIGQEFTKTGGIWRPAENLTVPFSPPDPSDFDHQLTEQQMFEMAVTVNEIVQVAYTRSILHNPTDEDVQDERNLGVTTGQRILTPADEERRGKRYKVPAMASVGGLELTGLHGCQETEGFAGVRIDFADESGDTRTVRATPEWAMIDDQPLDRETYQRLMDQMVYATVQPNRQDNVLQLVRNLVYLTSYNRLSRSFFGIVIDEDSSSDVVARIDYDPQDTTARTNIVGSIEVAERRGLSDPDSFYASYGQHIDKEASDESTEDIMVVTRQGNVIALRKPLNNPSRSSYEFTPSDPDFLAGVLGKIRDLETSRFMTRHVGGSYENRPLVIDRRGSGIGIRYDLGEAVLLTSVTSLGIPKVGRSMAEARRLGYDRQIQ